MDYAKHHKALVEYLKVKVEMRDWHGVSDAANDLRVLEANQPTMSAAEMYVKWRPYRTCVHRWNFDRDGNCIYCAKSAWRTRD